MTSDQHSQPQYRHLRIEPSSGWRSLNLREIWNYRELIYLLALRDIQVRYKQTLLGIAWALIQPVLTALIFSLFFGRLLSIESDGSPYPVFAYIGILVWSYFSNAATNASSSLVSNTNLVSKVYFPRLVIPIAAVLSGLVDFGIGLILLILTLPFLGMSLTLNVLIFPVLLPLLLLAALGVGVWLSALDVQYRDVRYAIPFVIQAWMFATPIIYPTRAVPEPFQLLFALNPLVGIIDAFRWSFLASGHLPWNTIVASTVVVAILLLSGSLYFRRMERVFADVI